MKAHLVSPFLPNFILLSEKAIGVFQFFAKKRVVQQVNEPTNYAMVWQHTFGENAKVEICFFDEKNVKGKAEQRKKAVAAHLQIRGDLTDRNVKIKGIRKCSLTIMLFCPTSFFLGYRKKESNSKRKRAVDCAGNNFLHGQKSTIAQLLSTTYSFYLITKSVLFCTQGLH